MTEKSRVMPFLAYVVVFHLAWIAWPYVVYPRLVSIGEATLAYALLNIGLRLLIWVVPVLLYLRYVDGVEPFSYLGLRSHVRRGVAAGAAVTALNLIGSMARFGPPHPVAQSITWNSMLGTSFLVGFIEEIPYRGFMLQKLAARMNFWVANAITSLLFVAIHVPGWIALHALTAPKAAGIFVFGAVMATVFRWSASLWAPVIAHSTNDFMSFVLFRV
jgi:membrane protease YdiL (CAAX protease family)